MTLFENMPLQWYNIRQQTKKGRDKHETSDVDYLGWVGHPHDGTRECARFGKILTMTAGKQ
jgi:hypothetical protein